MTPEVDAQLKKLALDFTPKIVNAYVVQMGVRPALELAEQFAQQVYDLAVSETRQQLWQPIETAPKDGTRLIALDVKGNIVKVHWDTLYEPAAWADEDSFFTSPLTYWLPIPDVPEAAGIRAASSPPQLSESKEVVSHSRK